MRDPLPSLRSKALYLLGEIDKKHLDRPLRGQGVRIEGLIRVWWSSGLRSFRVWFSGFRALGCRVLGFQGFRVLGLNPKPETLNPF